MPTLEERLHPGAFLVSEANGHRSREQGELASGQDLPAGAVVGQIAASGAYAAYDPEATDGSEEVAGILYAGIDASEGAAAAVIIRRDAEVIEDHLTWFDAATEGQITTGIAALAALGIIAR